LKPASNTTRVQLTLLASTLLTTFCAGAAAPSIGGARIGASIAETLVSSAALATPDVALDRRFDARDAHAPYAPFDAEGRARYTIVLREAPLASYRGGTPGFARPPVVASGPRRGRPDVGSPQARAYVDHLEQGQGAFVAEAARTHGRERSTRSTRSSRA
jgi:hypothetical protein